MADNKKFLDSAGLIHLWGKIKDNFANQLKYEDGELYLVDGLGQRLESTINARKFGAIAVDTYAELIEYAKADYVGLTLYLRQAVTDGAIEDAKVYQPGAYVVTGENGLLRLATSTATGDVNDAIVALEGRISVVEEKLNGVNFDTFATKKDVTDLTSVVEGKVNTTDFEQAIAGFVAAEDVYTKDEVDAMIPEVKFQSVAAEDKLLTLSEAGELKTDIAFGLVGNSIQLTGKNGEVLGSVDTADFVVDGMLNGVEWSEEDGKEDILVLSFNTDSGKQDIEVNFGKYVDAYSAGEGLSLSDKTFSVDFTKVAGAQALADLTTAFNGVKATVDSIDLTKYVEKVEGKGLSTEDFTTAHKTKLEGIDLSVFYTKDEVYNREAIDEMMPEALTTSEIDEALAKQN
jgi:hypothetical protein